MIDGNRPDVSSSVLAAPVCDSDSPGVSDGRDEPIDDASVSLMLRPEVVGNGCSGNQSEKGDLFFEGAQSQSNDDLSMRDLMKLMNQCSSTRG